MVCHKPYITIASNTWHLVLFFLLALTHTYTVFSSLVAQSMSAEAVQSSAAKH